MNHRRRYTSPHPQRLLERRIDRRLVAKAVRFGARTVNETEEARWRPLVRERRGGVPRASRRVGLLEGPRETTRPIRREVLHRLEAERPQTVSAADLMQSVGAAPQHGLESMPSSAGVPNRLVRSFRGPPRFLVRQERCAAERCLLYTSPSPRDS